MKSKNGVALKPTGMRYPEGQPRMGARLVPGDKQRGFPGKPPVGSVPVIKIVILVEPVVYPTILFLNQRHK